METEFCDNLRELLDLAEANKGNTTIQRVVEKLGDDIVFAKELAEDLVGCKYAAKIETDGRMSIAKDNQDFYNTDLENVIQSKDMHEILDEDDPRCFVIDFKEGIGIDDAKNAAQQMLEWANANKPDEDEDIKMSKVSFNKKTKRCEVRFINLIMASKQDMAKYTCDLISAGFATYIEMERLFKNEERFLTPGSVSRSDHDRLKRMAIRNPFRVQRIIARNRTYRSGNDLEQPYVIIIGNVIDKSKNYHNCQVFVNKSPEDIFVEHVARDKPSWYKEGEWIPKDIVLDEYKKMHGNISGPAFTSKIKGRLYSEEKRAQKDGKRYRMAKLKPFYLIQ